jgi:chaperone BCS1
VSDTGQAVFGLLLRLDAGCRPRLPRGWRPTGRGRHAGPSSSHVAASLLLFHGNSLFAWGPPHRSSSLKHIKPPLEFVLGGLLSPQPLSISRGKGWVREIGLSETGRANSGAIMAEGSPASGSVADGSGGSSPSRAEDVGNYIMKNILGKSLGCCAPPQYRKLGVFLHNRLIRSQGLDPILIVLFSNLSSFLANIGSVGSYVTGVLFSTLRKYIFRKVKILDDDILYRSMLTWMVEHRFKNTAFPSYQATAQPQGDAEPADLEAKPKEKKDEEKKSEEGGADFEASKPEGAGAVAAAEETSKPSQDSLISQEKMLSRSPIKFDLKSMTHIFFHSGRIFIVTHHVPHGHYYYWSESSMRYSGPPCELTIECLGRSLEPIRRVLQEAQTFYKHVTASKTSIYRPGGRSWDAARWEVIATRPSRPLDSVILDAAIKERLLRDVREYLDPRTKAWYVSRGIPYRRGYLLSGPPGTGKTSLTAALAGFFGLDIYVLSLLDKEIDEAALEQLFSRLPRRCIVLLEDIDAAGLTRKSVKKALSDKGSKKKSKRKSSSEEPASRVSLSGLLNAIDGVSSSEGRILIMTTNVPEELDPALVRPGRVDMDVKFQLPQQPEMKKMFLRMYEGISERSLDECLELAESKLEMANGSAHGLATVNKGTAEERLDVLGDRFAEAIPEGKLSGAALQGYLLGHKLDPESAVANVESWAESTIKDDDEKEKARLEAEEEEEEECYE